jgi:hypothetical protein
MINLLAAKFAQIASQIDITTAQITALQAKLSELQEHQQQLLSVEQACQSALSQVDTALMMLNHVDPSEINTFKDALVIKFNSDAIALIEPTAPAETATDTPTEPTAPAETDTTPTEPTASTPPDINPVIDVTATDTDTPDIEKSLDNLSLKNFRKLARSKNLDSRLNRATLTVRLKALVTRDEVLAIS